MIKIFALISCFFISLAAVQGPASAAPGENPFKGVRQLAGTETQTGGACQVGFLTWGKDRVELMFSVYSTSSGLVHMEVLNLSKQVALEGIEFVRKTVSSRSATYDFDFIYENVSILSARRFRRLQVITKFAHRGSSERGSSDAGSPAPGTAANGYTTTRTVYDCVDLQIKPPDAVELQSP
jgi:hypothetical protein